MMKHVILGLGLAALATLLSPTRAMADYTCWNPAICIAVCGSATCKDSSNTVDVGAFRAVSAEELKRELNDAPRNSAVHDAANAVMRSRGETTRAYTCWNPAICIAVCGSKTC
jgi:hypothetical protein